MYAYLNDSDPITFDKRTIIGALCKYIANKTGEFQPMSANMGLINYDEIRNKDKKAKNQRLAEISLEKIEETKTINNL